MNDRQACVAIRAFMLGLKEIRLQAKEHGFESASGLKFSLRFQYGSGVEVSSEPYASLQHVLPGDAQRSEALAVLREVVRLCPDMDLADWEAACREAVVGGVMRE